MTDTNSPAATRPAPPRTRDPLAAVRVNDEAVERFRHDHPGTLAPVVVVIPAYDEGESVARVVATVPAQLCGLDVAVLVVDDGSGDDTAERAARAGALVARLGANTGQGNAFKVAYRLASTGGAQYIATADADGQFDPKELERLLSMIVAGEADFVTGSRRLGVAHTDDSVRALGVVVFGRLISILTGVRITDPANGLRAMRAEVASRLDLRQMQYQSSELLIGVIANGFRVREAPVTMHKRREGASKKGGNLAYGWRFTRVVLTTWWRLRPVARENLPARQGLW
ncbi:MAG: glycosyltransferase family 2 protein [Acidimicrobiales bacterium]